MRQADWLTRLSSAAAYGVGTAWSKALLRSVGPRTKIHYTVRYWHPSGIAVGSDCEVRFGAFFDARSSKDVAIEVGNGCRIKDYVGMATYGGEIRLGHNVLVGRCSMIFGHGRVLLGDNTMLGPNVVISSSNHIAVLNGTPFQAQGFTRECVDIGANVWIGANASILAGATIEPHVVVGAGAVVTGRLETGWLYGGVPAVRLKRIPETLSEAVAVYQRDWGLL